MKPDPNPCHHVYTWVGSGQYIRSAGHRSKYIFFNIIGPFLPEGQGLHKGNLLGVKTLQPVISRVFCYKSVLKSRSV